MFDSIIRFSVRNKVVVALLVAAMAAWGIAALVQLPIDAVPDITNNQVQVVTIAPSLAPQEIEQYVTFPVEMALANMPGVEKIRSISRYGLSVVTVIFAEEVPVLEARQLTSEQIKAAAADIPAGLGTPEMMPISTGLGEIFQYIIEPLPGFENKYSLSELRSIQDWIIKRHLAGTPGVVEVSSFGGYVKQYEVSVQPDRLMALDITIGEIQHALATNNANTGGSYLEQGNDAFYIRSEGLVRTAEDIGSIVVATRAGVPVRIRDVAGVREGHVPRFGALTRNGQGEAVGGITLMLKGANSHAVIGHVKARMAEIQQSLPEGLTIRPYLDRAALVARTIQTVRTNLTEGGLIVIFVLVLLLGNLRAGLVVASVIPLAMLFAAGMMQVFGVSANLMSLGAIDFGLIVDGTVIIVENIVHQLHSRQAQAQLSQHEMDEVVTDATIRIRQSAAFGEIIILMVYLPILALEGIEGKMFVPMAQTVGFAILGALILSLTWAPMASALFLSRRPSHRRTLADRMIEGLWTLLQPVLNGALRRRGWVIGVTVGLFVLSLGIFSRLGGEFIPTLDEGDMAMQITVPAGSSLSHSVRTTTRVEALLKARFPEIIQIVSKIGTAEIPTDPMSMEDSDIVIALKPAEEWTSATSREALADSIKAALAEITAEGVSVELTQPIQLRFNELLTGAKADLAVNIFGDDLDQLAQLGEEAAEVIRQQQGAADVKVDRTEGFPQIVVRYRRDALAAYGLSVQEANEVLEAAFAGGIAGTIFEQERRYELVVRLAPEFRQSVAHLESLRLRLPSGQQVPFSAIAEIRMEAGPMLISHENTRRRITIGINVRNRDVESLVTDIRAALARQLDLPPGYTVTYGGEFENLQSARARLGIAVPVALGLILVLLYLTFQSMRQALIMFSAIPFSAIGGIVALWIRDMPFSISAGIGFIALFGVAVLNGIVLIGYFNYLKAQGYDNLYERIRAGVQVRLRPVIMTAAVASLGFLPMALSHSAGAEVQRPLATVVIGGLITATLLTLIVIPVIYSLVGDAGTRLVMPPRPPRTGKQSIAAGILLLCGLAGGAAQAQSVVPVPMETFVSMARDRSVSAQEARQEAEMVRARMPQAIPLGETRLQWQQGQINGQVSDYFVTLDQDLGRPFTLRPTRQVFEASAGYQAAVSERASLASVAEALTQAYVWRYHQARISLLSAHRDTCLRWETIAARRASAGATNRLEVMTVRQMVAEADIALQQAYLAADEASGVLRQHMRSDTVFVPAGDWPARLTPDYEMAPFLAPEQAQTHLRLQEMRLAQTRYTPALSMGYFRQSLESQGGFQGFQVGISVPLAFQGVRAEVEVAHLRALQAAWALETRRELLRLEIRTLMDRLSQQQAILTRYETSLLPDAREILAQAQTLYAQGEADYLTLALHTRDAVRIQEQYLAEILAYNQLVIRIQQLFGW